MATLLTHDLLRAARAMLGWTQRELAERSGLTQKEVSDFQSAKRQMTARASAKLKSAFENADLLFIAANTARSDVVGAGVRWRPPDGRMDIKIL